MEAAFQFVHKGPMLRGRHKCQRDALFLSPIFSLPRSLPLSISSLYGK